MIEINRAALTAADLRTLANSAFPIEPPNDNATPEQIQEFAKQSLGRIVELTNLMDRVVVGGAASVPADQFHDAISEISNQFWRGSEVKNSNAGS